MDEIKTLKKMLNELESKINLTAEESAEVWRLKQLCQIFEENERHFALIATRKLKTYAE